MNKVKIIGACTDLGVDVDGAYLGPKDIIKELDNDYDTILINKSNDKKSKDKNDLRKNLKQVNEFNTKLFNTVKETVNNKEFPITIGGDHSLAIGSVLASNELNGPIGIIWIDAHLDYNTFETTITGNLHGLPLAAINGICKDLTTFTNKFVNPANTVVVGYRSKETNRGDELNNIKKMGVHVFDEDDIDKYGIREIMLKAFEIASNNTKGIHISYDLDSINPKVAPGVSVPEEGGFNLNEAYEIKDILIENIHLIKSFDLVEYNPLFDINYKTKNIALNILNDIITTIEK